MGGTDRKAWPSKIARPAARRLGEGRTFSLPRRRLTGADSAADRRCLSSVEKSRPLLWKIGTACDDVASLLAGDLTLLLNGGDVNQCEPFLPVLPFGGGRALRLTTIDLGISDGGNEAGSVPGAQRGGRPS